MSIFITGIYYILFPRKESSLNFIEVLLYLLLEGLENRVRIVLNKLGLMDHKPIVSSTFFEELKEGIAGPKEPINVFNLRATPLPPNVLIALL